jgi:hypothetical protein
MKYGGVSAELRTPKLIDFNFDSVIYHTPMTTSSIHPSLLYFSSPKGDNVISIDQFDQQDVGIHLQTGTA